MAVAMSSPRTCGAVRCSNRSLRLAMTQPRPTRCRSAVLVQAQYEATGPHVQLGTARLDSNVKIPVFISSMYQFASSITTTGANYPMVLPLKADRLSESSFKISMLKRLPEGRGFDSAADIVTSVEDVPDVGKVLMVRLYEGPAGQADRRVGAASTNEKERLDQLVDSLVDVKTLMSTFPAAIKSAARAASE